MVFATIHSYQTFKTYSTRLIHCFYSTRLENYPFIIYFLNVDCYSVLGAPPYFRKRLFSLYLLHSNECGRVVDVIIIKNSYSYNYVGVPVKLVEIYSESIDPWNLIWLKPAEGTYSLAMPMFMRSSVSEGRIFVFRTIVHL